MKFTKHSVKPPAQNLCPCESGKPYSACCEPYHKGTPAPTAEALMRSRYTAYVRGMEDYLLQTWHSDTCPATLDLGLTGKVQTKWLGLQIKQFVSLSESSATVEFIARYKIAGKAERLHENSQFRKINQRWYYLDGVFID
ncbi:MAG: YchJ family protein [Methylotenera sp.]